MRKLAARLEPGELFWTESGNRYRAGDVRVSEFGTVSVDVGIGHVAFNSTSMVNVHE